MNIPAIVAALTFAVCAYAEGFHLGINVTAFGYVGMMWLSLAVMRIGRKP
jgi:hypothetical protein